MKSNLKRKEPNSGNLLEVEVLSDCLEPYGLPEGTVCTVESGEPQGAFVEVWALDGELHARHLRPTGAGWFQAYTWFHSAGEVCYSLTPDQMKRIERMGWIRVKVLPQS